MCSSRESKFIVSVASVSASLLSHTHSMHQEEKKKGGKEEKTGEDEGGGEPGTGKVTWS